MKSKAGSARSLAAHAVARILREGVTLDTALKDALAAADPKLAPSVRSLSYSTPASVMIAIQNPWDDWLATHKQR